MKKCSQCIARCTVRNLYTMNKRLHTVTEIVTRGSLRAMVYPFWEVTRCSDVIDLSRVA